jgi:hypothetical protein
MQRYSDHARDFHNLFKLKRPDLTWHVPILNKLLEVSHFFNALNQTYLVKLGVIILVIHFFNIAVISLEFLPTKTN